MTISVNVTLVIVACLGIGMVIGIILTLLITGFVRWQQDRLTEWV
jgi:hypothetical protein